MTTNRNPEWGDAYDEMAEGAGVATEIVTAGLHAVAKARGATPDQSVLRAEVTMTFDDLGSPLKAFGAIGFLSGVSVAILLAYADEVGKDPVAMWQEFCLRYAAGKDEAIERLKKENEE